MGRSVTRPNGPLPFKQSCFPVFGAPTTNAP
jgi:hypothetical protein